MDLPLLKLSWYYLFPQAGSAGSSAVCIFLSITAAVHTVGVQWKCLDLCGKQKESEGYSKSSVAQLRGVLSRSLNQETEYNRITQRALSVLKGEYKEQYKQHLLDQLPY